MTKLKADRESPFRTIALAQFSRAFQKDLSVQAEITDFEQSIIEIVFSNRFFRQYKGYDKWIQVVRTCYHFMNQGFLISSEPVAKAFLNTANQMQSQLNRAYASYAELQKIEGLPFWKQRIENRLAYYKLLYEGVYRILISPVSLGYYFYTKSLDKKLVPKSDGKVVLGVLEKIERWKREPEKRLSRGLNSHVRNAYSHENFRVLDDGDFELWDVDPNRPSKNWGPEKWHVTKLEELCRVFEQTIDATALAICLFSINYRRLILARGWHASLSSPSLTREDVRGFIEHYADTLYFGHLSTIFENGRIVIRLKTRHRGIDQTREIFEGGESFVRRYKQGISYHEAFIAAQCLGFFQLIAAHICKLGKIDTIACEIVDIQDKEIGVAEIAVSAMSAIIGGKVPLALARRILCRDTLGDAKMWYKKMGTAVEQ